MIIGDASSDEDEEKKNHGQRESVSNARNFFERLSKSSARDNTPEFRTSVKNQSKPSVQSNSKPTSDNDKPNKLKALLQRKNSEKKQEPAESPKKKRNIFAPKQTATETKKKETVIGDESSDEEEKRRRELDEQERRSFKHTDSKYNFSAKEGVVQSINFDVATLTNYHEALIKSQKSAAKNKTDIQSQSESLDGRKSTRVNIFARNSDKPKGKGLFDLIKKKKERVIGDDSEEESKNLSQSSEDEDEATHAHHINIFEASNEEDEDAVQSLPLAERIFMKLYYSIVDRMTVSILNNAFYDIRTSASFDACAEGIINSVVANMISSIPHEAYNFVKEEEECRLREIRAYEERRKAEQLQREAQLREKQLQKQLAIQQTEEACNGIFDQMIFVLVESMAER